VLQNDAPSPPSASTGVTGASATSTRTANDARVARFRLCWAYVRPRLGAEPDTVNPFLSNSWDGARRTRIAFSGRRGSCERPALEDANEAAASRPGTP
jgi:hypothetical protein